MASRTRTSLLNSVQVTFLLLAAICTTMGGAEESEAEKPMADQGSSFHSASRPQQVPHHPQAQDAGSKHAGSHSEAGSHVVRSHQEADAGSDKSDGYFRFQVGGSHGYSHSASQAGGSHSMQSSYSVHSSSSSYHSSGSKESSSSGSSGSSSSSSHGGSSLHQVISEASRGAGQDSVDRSSHGASAVISHESDRSRASSSAQRSHSMDRQRSQSADRRQGNEDRRRQDRAEQARGRSQSDAQSSGDVRSSASSGDDSRRRSASAQSSGSQRSSYYRQLISRRCQDCIVNGQTYKGHSRFEYTEDCQQFRCICRCNGTHTCPPKHVLNVCGDGEGEGDGRAVGGDRQNSDLRRRRCQECEVLGQKFEGNNYFDVQDGCTKFRACVCYCNGTWVCPSERAVDVCGEATPNPATPNPCRACNAQGKVVAANSVFELEEPCRRYRQCRCHCNGSWECPARFAENTCQSPTAVPQEEYPGCQSCSLPNQRQVQGNTYFDRRDGCLEYKNCVCRCNGSWTCPAQASRNLCQDSASSEAQRGALRQPVSSSQCQSCLALGRYFRGNTYFNTRRGCRSYRNCVCRCDGSWDCPSRYVTDLCRDDDPTNDVDNPNATCSFCDAEGKIITPNSFFNLTKDCTQYTSCLCHCDGAWTCEEQSARDVCGGDGSGQRVPQTPQPGEDCKSCLVDSRVVRGNSYFDFTSACYRYRDCLCKCDGTYHCQPERAQNICRYSTTASASSSAASSSSSSSSSSSLAVVTAAPSCVRCLAFGQLHEAETDFVHEEDCVEYECRCHCNGSYTCPMERARRTCQPGCRECEVSGQFFEGNTYFQHAQGCVVYLCTCFCNGSYSCPPERANNTCHSQPGGGGRPDPADVDPQRGQSQCQQCVANDGSSHAPNTDFQLQEGCIHYQCRCHCDGSWNCPGEKARNTCRGEVLGGCRSCVLSDSQIYHGGEEFQKREGCIHYQCQCRCDGSWHCPGEKARDICLGEVPGGCRVCRVSRNETYRGGSSFQLRQGCYHYQCQCRCNGSWECPGDTARDVCIGEVPGGCRVCKMESGEIYLGESDFQMVKNCIHYNCRCNCDGSWNCPGERARRVCNADGSPLREPIVTTPSPARCRRCVVSERETFAPNQDFSLRRGCNLFQCECQCDGSWNCPPSQTRDLCQRRQDPALQAQTCLSCRMPSYTYPGRSTFLLTRGCAQYSCECDCQGRWTCDHRVARDICQDDGQGGGRAPPGRQQVVSVLSSVSSDRSPQQAYQSLVADVKTRASSTARGSSVSAANLGSVQARGQVSAPCRPCRVEGQDRSPNSDFVLDRKCKRFHCHCSCNGRWRCPRNQTEDLCEEEKRAYNEQERRRAAGRRQQVPSGAQRYGRANIRVVGADSSSSSSSSSSQGRRQGEINVRGYYVNSEAQSYRADGRQAGQQFYGQADNSEVILRQDGHSASSALSEAEGGKEGRESGSGCTPCQVDNKVYRTGAKFDWRRGCLIYKCSCLCSGSYRCRLSVDPDCRDQEPAPGSGGIPTGPAQGGRLAGLPGGSCGNCYVQGFVYPGNMSFTLREGCKELSCHCRCDGNHKCSEQKPIAGCVAMSTPLGGASYPLSASVFPMGGGAYGAHPGRVINAFQQTLISSNCPSCGGQGPLMVPVLVPHNPDVNPDQSSGQHRFPLSAQPHQEHDASAQGSFSEQYASQYLVNPQSHAQSPQYAAARFHSGSSVMHVPMQPVQRGGEGMMVGDSQADEACATCFVNGQLQRGSFQFTNNCSLVNCHCDCDGRLLCSVRQAPDEVCRAQARPNSPRGGCVNCQIQGQEFPQDQFSLRIGCYGYNCTCRCDGAWWCPRQQPTNYCVKPPGHPASPSNDGQKDSSSQHHYHAGGKAGLEDSSHSQSAELRDNSGKCQDCQIGATTYPSRTRFLLREGCLQKTCDCACDGSWACAKASTVDVCRQEGKGQDDDQPAKVHLQAMLQKAAVSPDGCPPCQWGNDTYPGGASFSHTEGCWQFFCQCGCGGEMSCPPEDAVDLCRAGHSQALRDRLQDQDDRLPLPLDCKPCLVDGQLIRSRNAFSRSVGCQEFLCQCECNGTFTCPPDRSINTCQMNNSPESPSSSADQPPFKGCKVGRKTYFTRLFAFRDGCVQHMCICYNSGAWRCPKGKERSLC